MDFLSSVESYHEENSLLVPDVDNIQILSEGVTLVPTARSYARSVNSMEINIDPIVFDISVNLTEQQTLKATAKFKPSILATIDYSNFTIREFSYTNTTTTTLSATYSSGFNVGDEDPDNKQRVGSM